MVNNKIKEGIEVTSEEISMKEAQAQGVVGEFEDKYGETVTVYKIGDYSAELCGGPHVKNISELGQFKIKKEEFDITHMSSKLKVVYGTNENGGFGLFKCSLLGGV